MFKKSIEAIIAQGLLDLDGKVAMIISLAEEAKKEVELRKNEMTALVQLAKDIPEKIFDRYSGVMVATVDLPKHQCHNPRISLVYGMERPLTGLMGPNELAPGTYRAIVLWVKVQ